ncbi:MAG: DHH family phosphoesterase [Candidatus Omnitrophota bacterium]
MHTKEFRDNLKATVDLILKSQQIVLACHMNPDGDSIGSMLGLGLGLMKMKKKVTMLCSDKIPERYISLPKAKTVQQVFSKPVDLAISLDCASINQLPGIDKIFKQSKCIVEIDHHIYRDQFGDVQLVSEHTASVGEIVFDLLKELNVKLDRQIAECLLTSAIVETSSFSCAEVNKRTFETCAKLLETNVNFNSIAERYYWRKNLAAMYLTGLSFMRIKTAHQGKIVWSIIYKEDFKEHKGKQEDVDPVADDLLMLAGAEVSLFFREIENNMLRVSLRSKGKIDVGYLATTYGGGGHDRVSSCRIHKTKTGIEHLIRQASLLVEKNKRS